jgi:hypothetical protein
MFRLRARNAEIGEHMRIHYLELPHFDAMVPVVLPPSGGPGKQIRSRSGGERAGAGKIQSS